MQYYNKIDLFYDDVGFINDLQKKLKHISRATAYLKQRSSNRQTIIMSQATELLKAKAIIKEQQERIEELQTRLAFKAPQGHIINQRDHKDCLYWGANNGYLTIWRLPAGLVYNPGEEDKFGECFGNKWCLGEEWGELMNAEVRTITQEMVDKENFEDEDDDSDSEEEEEEEDDDDRCDCCVKGWSKANEFGRCGCNCPSGCGKLMRDCQYGCSEEAKPETVHEILVRIIAEQIKKQEEGGAVVDPSVPITVQVYGLDVLRGSK